MARTADRYLKYQAAGGKGKKIWRAGNYLRLSVDSDYTGSDSLDNQRRLAKEYVKAAPDIVIEREYIDDGRTGTNFERPAFVRMMADLRRAEIDCIIVKDLSRFGRECVEAGNYIEKVFPFLRVRFISIVDRFDSDDPECDRELLLISLKNLMHEMYAKDISKKVGSTFLMKQEKGIFYRSATLPYGYKMDKDNRNYCIDEPAAKIVREIFSLYSQGTSKYAICQYLHQNKILTPKQYRQTGRVRQEAEDELKIWQMSAVNRMLRNPVYIGTIVRHKTAQSLFEGKKATIVPEEERVLLMGNHPAIIREDLFREVQNRLEQLKEEYIGYRKESDRVKDSKVFEGNIFQGKLFCGNCGTAMIRRVNYRTVNGGKERYKEYHCGMHTRIPENCNSGSIEEGELCNILSASVRKQLSLIKGLKKLVDGNVKYSFEGRLQKLESARQRIANSQTMLKQDYLREYAKYTAGKVTSERFQDFRKTYLEKLGSCKEQSAGLEKEEKKLKRQSLSIRRMFREWMAVGGKRRLTEEMVQICIERIEVFPDNRIEVKLRYQDIFDLLKEWVEVRAENQ